MITVEDAARVGGEVISAIHEGEPAPLHVVVLAYIFPLGCVVFHDEGRGGYVVWDPDTDVDIYETEDEAMRSLTRGLANTYGGVL